MLYIFRTQEIIYFYANGIFCSHQIILNGCKEYIKKLRCWFEIPLVFFQSVFNISIFQKMIEILAIHNSIHSYILWHTYCKVTKNRIRYQISNFFIVVVKSFIHDRTSNESKHQFHFSICIREIVTRILLSASVALL